MTSRKSNMEHALGKRRVARAAVSQIGRLLKKVRAAELIFLTYLLEMALAEVRRGTEPELLSAGAILTGGASALPGIDLLAEEVLSD